MVWGLEAHNGIKSWRVNRKVEQLFTEYRDRAEWGSLHFSGPSVSRPVAEGISTIWSVG